MWADGGESNLYFHSSSPLGSKNALLSMGFKCHNTSSSLLEQINLLQKLITMFREKERYNCTAEIICVIAVKCTNKKNQCILQTA